MFIRTPHWRIGLACLAALAMTGAVSYSRRAAAASEAAVAGPASLVGRASPHGAREARPAATDSAASDSAAQPRDTASADYRIVVSLRARRLWVIDGGDTALTAPVAVSMPTALAYAGRTWHFATPRGERRVLGKEADPVWVPPDWHYAEIARDNHLRLDSLRAAAPVPLVDGRTLAMRHGEAGVIRADGAFAALPTDEEIIFDSTLYIPPLGSKNRRVTGELGRYRLDIGGGYLLHGTPDSASIGTASTHGCLRLSDDAIAWLYRRIPIGTPVQIY